MLECGINTVNEMLAVINENTKYREAIIALYKAQGYKDVFFFADGFTYTEANDVGIYEDGTAWTYVDAGALPVTIAAGTVPSEGVYSKLKNKSRIEVDVQSAGKDNPEVGRKYTINGGKYDVVSAADVGGFYLATLENGNKLKYIVDGDVYLEHMGVNETNSVSTLSAAQDLAIEFGVTVRTNSTATKVHIDSSMELKTDTVIVGDVTLGASVNITVVADEAPSSVDFSDLSGTDVLSSKITGFPTSAIGRTVLIESSAILTERYNPPSNTPYYKNTAFTLMDDEGNITPSLDMSFGAGDNPTVSILHEDRPINICFGSLYPAGSSGTAYSSLIIARSNVKLAIGSTASEGVQNATTIALSRCGGTNIVIANAEDTDYAGLGYALSLGLSTETIISGGKFTKNRKSIDGRHCANVLIENITGGDVGTHWGNGFKVVNCNIENVSYSGKDLTVEGGSAHGSYLINNRSDVYFCIGKLTVSNVLMGANVLRLLSSSSSVPSDIWTDPRSMFDEISVDGISFSSAALSLVTFEAGVSTMPPKYVEFNNVLAVNGGDVVVLSASNGNEFVNTATENNYSFKDIKTSGDVSFIIGSPSSAMANKLNINVSSCGGDFTVSGSADVIGNLVLDGVNLVKCQRIGVATGVCNITVSNSKVVSPAFFIEANYHFHNNEYSGVVGVGSLGTVLSQMSCKALIGSSGYVSPLNYYVNPSTYIV